jgi:hypothetical protein
MPPTEPPGQGAGAGPPPAPFPVRAMMDRSGPHPVTPASGRREGWLALVAGVLLLTSIGLGVAWSRERAARARQADALGDQVRALQGRVEVAEEEADEYQEALDALSGPQLSAYELLAPGAREAKGRVFWDRVSGAWTMVAQELAAAGRGRTYQLWLVARDGQRINAGTFEPDASGRALLRASYELEPARFAGVEVTEEPEGGSPQPSTAPVLTAAAR